jgi:hypothetical protein
MSKYNISASFNIPYNGWHQFNGKTLKNIYYNSEEAVQQDINRDIMVRNEIANMDFLEDEIQEMTSFPEVEQLLEKIVKKG